MMIRTACLLCAIAIVSLATCSQGYADEGSAALPEALTALDLDGTAVVSDEEALTVRGEGGPIFWVNGYLNVHNYVTTGSVPLQITSPTSLHVVFLPWYFSFSF